MRGLYAREHTDPFLCGEQDGVSRRVAEAGIFQRYLDSKLPMRGSETHLLGVYPETIPWRHCYRLWLLSHSSLLAAELCAPAKRG